MTKKLLPFFLLLLACNYFVIAQNVVNKAALQQFSGDNAAFHKGNYQRALQLAKQKNWPVYIETKNGGAIQLVGISENGKPKYITTYNNIIAAATTRANQLWPGGSSGLNLTGSSNAIKGKLAIWDGGSVLNTHVELNGRITWKDAVTATNDHATHTSGTMIAAGVNPLAKGMAYGAQQLIAYTFGTNEHDITNMALEAPNLLLSNHSYGYTAGWYYDGTNWIWEGDINVSKTEDYTFGYYDSTAYKNDYIARNAPYYLICMSAGNQRNSNGPAVGATYKYYDSSYNLKTSTRPAGISNNDSYGTIAYTQTAKNILTVGAVNGIPAGYSAAGDVVMSSFSGWGPTDDGRIKPDIVADGVNVLSSVATSDNAYASYSGTSMACPNATGSLYLVQEYYNKLHTSSFLTSSALKGLAIHTADEAGSYPGPDYQFGWGLLNVLKATNVITSSYNHISDTIIENSLTVGQTYTFAATASGKGPLKATLAWIDPAGTVIREGTVAALNNTTPKLINDLDLRITKGSTVYKPWVLDPNFPTLAATTGDNKLDNVEKVEVDSTVPGQIYTITVTTKNTALVGNSQNFSLLISGIGGTAYCTSAATSSVGTRIDSLNFAGIANKNSGSCTTYSNYTNLTAQIQPNQTIPITVKVNSCDATTANKVIKVYIDYNSNGSFTDPGELVATSPVINGAGVFTANITTPYGLVVNNYSLMRIVAQETSDTSLVKPCNNYSNGETQDYRVQFIAPTTDLAISDIVAPLSGSCANGNQFLVVNIKNNGSASQTNVPLTATVSNGTTTVATFSAVYPGTISGGSSVNYTFQKPFATVGGTTYSINAKVNSTGDQDTSNNAKTLNATIAGKATLSAAGEICSNTALLKISNASSSANYFWYSKSTLDSSFANGVSATSSVIPSDKTFYVQSGANFSAGPLNKNTYPSTGYYRVYPTNTVSYNNYTSTIPLVLNAVRLYSKYPGTVTISVADVTVSGTSIYTDVFALQNINVYATSATLQSTDGAANDLADSGAYYNVNLQLPAGSHSIVIGMDGAASVYRNENTTVDVAYPMGIPGVFQITGNNKGVGVQQKYYNFFYDMKLSSIDCLSDVVPVVATTATVPSITQAADSLVCSIANAPSYQWYFNGNGITGATNKSYKPTQAGAYYVATTDSYGCTRASANYNYVVVVTAVQNVSASEIGLETSPNPTNGLFNISFYLSNKADVSVELINAGGQKCLQKFYTGFSGQFNQQYAASNIAGGTYILKVQANNKVYTTKVLIVR